MVVCNCFNVRESDLASLVRSGTDCLRSVRAATGLGSNCGKCIPQAMAALQASLGSGRDEPARPAIATPR